MRYPRYTTFGSDDELTAAINKVDPLRSTSTMEHLNPVLRKARLRKCRWLSHDELLQPEE